jgi:peptidyl-prolyl cis-trans isomerase D
MISWIQRTFQRHFRVIFGILLGVIIISFIFTIGSTPGIGRADHSEVARDYFGHNILSKDEMQGMMGDAHLSANLEYGSNVGTEQLQFYAFQRAASLHLADELHLPAPGTAEITDFIKGLRIFAGPGGQFDVGRYDAFRSGLRSNSTITEADIARVISDDTRVDKIQRLLGGPGYLLPTDVNSVILKADTVWTISTAEADYAAFNPAIDPTEAELSKFFADNSFRYTVAPHVSVSYVDFPASAYLAQEAPTDAEVREYYDTRPGRFPRPQPAKAPALKPDPEADFKAVQPQVRTALQLERARRDAVKAASDLAYALYEGKVARGAPLDAFLTAHNLKAANLAPFARDTGPAELGGSHEIANAAFELNADRFYSEGLPSADGAVVIFWNDSYPAHQPLLAVVRDKVRADVIDDVKRKRFIELGKTLKAAIELRLKAQEPFAKAAEEAGGAVKLVVKSYPPFAYRDQPHDIDPAVTGTLDRLEKGGVSSMVTPADKPNLGILVYAADKKAPSLDESNARYVQIRAQLAMTYARTASAGILDETVAKELKRTDPNPEKSIQ